MSSERVSRLAVTAVAFACVAVAVGLAGLVLADRRLAQLGHPDLQQLHGEVWLIVVGIVSSTVVGAALSASRPRHPVGWLFLALAGSMVASGVVDEYAVMGVLARPGSLPGAEAVAVIGNSTFIPWLVLVALVLQLTPTGSTLGRGWRAIAGSTVILGVVAFVSGLLSRGELSAPFGDVDNPMALGGVSRLTDVIHAVAIIGVGVGLVASAFSLLVRFRRATGSDRRQLLWLAFVAAPLPIFVVIAFVASEVDNNAVTLWATGGFIVLIPVAAGLSVTRFHLYDVERLLSRTFAYTLLTAILVATYTAVVLVSARRLSSWSAGPELSATLGAVTAAAVAAPLRLALQDLIDRQFNRRRYNATRVVRAALSSAGAGVDVEAILRRALADRSLTVSYPRERSESWTTADGAVAAEEAAAVDVRHHGLVVAKIGFDPAVVDVETVAQVAELAAAELDNTRLRAELVRRLAEVGESRSRLAGAQEGERRRIERDLHDGAQQRLLALAFQLQAAHVNGDHSRLQDAVADGVVQARQAVRELRELAGGLHPTALADGGLTAALEDLARRSLVPIAIESRAGRVHPSLEFTAWLIACEAVVNAQKHARATHIRVTVVGTTSELRFTVSDDGCGGADVEGSGLQGIRDRAEAAGGSLDLRSPVGRGTTVEVALPCGS